VYKILLKQDLVPNIHLLKIAAPNVTKKAQPGQFAVLRIDERGERIPLTLADWDEDEGSVTVVFLEVGTTTHRLSLLKTGDSIANFVAPLGLPSHIEKLGTVVCAGGCYGISGMLPIARAMRQAGNKVISVIEARSKNTLFWEDKLRSVSDELIVAIGDGSHAAKGWAPDQLEKLAKRERVDLVTAMGCPFMMMLCSEVTKPLGIKTTVHLNPIMVDGTGMCGCCRVSVGGETKFACVDGPEFDGHQVDWDLLQARRSMYFGDEVRSLHAWECENWDKL
jgi:NAD(P)H-flavin reductase